MRAFLNGTPAGPGISETDYRTAPKQKLQEHENI